MQNRDAIVYVAPARSEQFLASSVAPPAPLYSPEYRAAHHHEAYSANMDPRGGYAKSAMQQQVPRKPPHHKHSKRKKSLVLRDRIGRAIEIDSDDEDNWDRGVTQRKVWGQKEGPMRDRPVDDFLISFRDLFPCLAPIFESCGCIRRKPRRQLMNRSVPTEPGGGPRVEQVCLDCGNVLEVKNLPGTIAMDMYDRGTAERHQAFLEIADTPAPSMTFQGYETWQGPKSLGPMGTHGIALPHFEMAPPRVLKNTPQSSTLHAEDEFVTDDTGHIILPKFNDP